MNEHAPMTLEEALMLVDKQWPTLLEALQALQVLRSAMFSAVEEIDTIAYRCDRISVQDTEHQLNQVSNALVPLKLCAALRAKHRGLARKATP